MRNLLSLFLAGWCTLASAVEEPSPAQRKIAEAEAALAASPGNREATHRLAMAYTQRARETADSSYYDRALDLVDASSGEGDPDLRAGKVRVWALLGKHEFQQALKLARELNRRAPDDVIIYGLLTDAYVELGRYEEAEETAQWMLDLRPGNLPGLTRGAFLRELFGDIDGAVEWMETAYSHTYFYEVEDRAWMLTQVAHLERSRGNLERAEAMADQALALFADYHYALKEMASIRLAQSRPLDAVELLETRYSQARHPENLYDLALARLQAGQTGQAREDLLRFEEQALAESRNVDNANRELVFLYADQLGRPDDALAIAKLSEAKRRDVMTLDAYAWALHKAGKHERAWEQMQLALAPGVRRAAFLYHAGEIARSLGKLDEAREYFDAALGLNPRSEVAESVRDAKSALDGGRGGCGA